VLYIYTHECILGGRGWRGLPDSWPCSPCGMKGTGSILVFPTLTQG
jgi:rubredoxin